MPMLTLDAAMLVSAVVLAATFAGIFTEGIHHIHRTKVAMVGAAAMVFAGQLVGFYSPEQAIEAIDWNVVFLLGAMMLIIAVMIPTGGFQAISFHIARVSGGRQFLLLAMLGTAVTLLSMLLDNVTTVVIFGPLIVLICEVLKVSPIPYLLAAALLTDTSGVATLIGDPPNLMIGSAADIDFKLAQVMTPATLVVHPDTPLWEGIRQLVQHGSPIPVVDAASGELKGLLSVQSVMGELAKLVGDGGAPR